MAIAWLFFNRKQTKFVVCTQWKTVQLLKCHEDAVLKLHGIFITLSKRCIAIQCIVSLVWEMENMNNYLYLLTFAQENTVNSYVF